jgi:hypothetical protein
MILSSIDLGLRILTLLTNITWRLVSKHRTVDTSIQLNFYTLHTNSSSTSQQLVFTNIINLPRNKSNLHTILLYASSTLFFNNIYTFLSVQFCSVNLLYLPPPSFRYIISIKNLIPF